MKIAYIGNKPSVEGRFLTEDNIYWHGPNRTGVGVASAPTKRIEPPISGAVRPGKD